MFIVSGTLLMVVLVGFVQLADVRRKWPWLLVGAVSLVPAAFLVGPIGALAAALAGAVFAAASGRAWWLQVPLVVVGFALTFVAGMTLM